MADWLIQNSEGLWCADPTLMTVSGFSVGGNLALGIAQRLSRSEYRVKAAVLFYTPVGDIHFSLVATKSTLLVHRIISGLIY